MSTLDMTELCTETKKIICVQTDFQVDIRLEPIEFKNRQTLMVLK